MTRDEILVAVNKAFEAEVWANRGSWTITIETTPRRQLILADALVEKLKDGSIDTVEFEGILLDARDAHWAENKDSSLAYLLK